MKNSILPLIALLSLFCCASVNESTEALSKSDTPENRSSMPVTIKAETQIKSTITTLFNAADARDWATVADLFTDSVQMDYSDLGAEPAVQSPEQIIAGWSAMLPGFERTIHQPHNFAIWVAGDRATATYDAFALHYLPTGDDLGDNHWTVFAGYNSEFEKINGEWKLAATRLSLYKQMGNTALPGLALENVRTNQLPRRSEIVGPTAKSTATRFFSSLEAAELEDFLNVWAEDGRQLMPLSPRNFPEELTEKKEILKQYAGVVNFESQAYDYELLATSNSEVVIVKYHGEITTAGDATYNNTYLGLMEIDEMGKLKNFVEVFNPNILINDFPGLDPIHYSVHQAGAGPADGVSLEEVAFQSQGDQLIGHLFTPPGFEKGGDKTYPAVIVTGSWTSVKEQMPDEYASILAREGLLALTFDFRGFGESEGQPRQLEDHKLKIEDIIAAVDFLTEHPRVDVTNISGLGVCASSGYLAHATARDERISKLALVAPWLHNPEMAEMLYAGRPGGAEALIEKSRNAQRHYEATGEMTYDLAASELDVNAAMYVPNGAFDYYLNPAKAAGVLYDNRWAVTGWEPWLTFDGIAAADEIEVPVHIVHSEMGAVPQGAKDFIGRLKNEPRVIWLNDYTQQDLYFRSEAVEAAMSSTSNWLKSTVSR